MSSNPRRLTRNAAEETYIRAGELEVFRQLRRDALMLDAGLAEDRALALGPFARLQAGTVVEELGKTRGAINHLWGSQEAFRAAVMHVFLNDPGLGAEDVPNPAPGEFADLDGWIHAFAEAEIARGPRHGMEPDHLYGLRWAAWLALAPYGLWSERVAADSIEELQHRITRYAHDVLEPALERFGLSLAPSTSVDDLALAVASVVEGFWLNACLSLDDPIGRPGGITSSLATALRLVIRGATTH